MKTQMNIANLKKAAATLSLALVLSSASFAQPSPVESGNDEMAAVSRLETIMNATDEAIRYVAPAAEETEELASAISRLDVMANVTEAAVKYSAPEAIEVAPEMERLDVLASATEAELQYKAPAAEENENVTAELDRLDNLAAATQASLVFKAPATDATIDAPEADNNSEYMLANKF